MYREQPLSFNQFHNEDLNMKPIANACSQSKMLDYVHSHWNYTFKTLSKHRNVPVVDIHKHVQQSSSAIQTRALLRGGLPDKILTRDIKNFFRMFLSISEDCITNTFFKFSLFPPSLLYPPLFPISMTFMESDRPFSCLLVCTPILHSKTTAMPGERKAKTKNKKKNEKRNHSDP